jgi:ABC-type phosphate/phosphonate transport system substrate-binding protein
MAEQAFHTLEKQQSKAAAFRILHRTARIPRPLFVVHRRVPKSDRDALLRTIVDWPKTEDGKRLLEAGHFAPFVPASDAEYAAVRRYLQSRK